jgi:hypothetical protein
LDLVKYDKTMFVSNKRMYGIYTFSRNEADPMMKYIMKDAKLFGFIDKHLSFSYVPYDVIIDLSEDKIIVRSDNPNYEDTVLLYLLSVSKRYYDPEFVATYQKLGEEKYPVMEKKGCSIL